MKQIGLVLILCGLAATGFGAVANTPEIDGSTAMSGVCLLAGAFMVIRSRRK